MYLKSDEVGSGVYFCSKYFSVKEVSASNLSELMLDTSSAQQRVTSPALPHFHDSHPPIFENEIPQNHLDQYDSSYGSHS
jgi:hypothetical protein